jgi:transcriptional regulator with XRE-family HTH domain
MSWDSHHHDEQADERRRAELADFLRTRRARIAPQDTGLPAGGRRRTPGLRREEVALLASVSASYYTWLEQARPVNASPAVLDAIAVALRLDDDERTHLRTLASPPAERSTTAPASGAAPEQLQQLLDHQGLFPAYVADARLDVLAWNAAAADVVFDFGALPPAQRNVVWLLFAERSYRERLRSWEEEAREAVAVLRMYAAQHPNDAWYGALSAELSERSDDFAAWWAAHDVRRVGLRTRAIDHPRLGLLELERLSLTPAAAPDLRLCVLTAPPGSETYARLAARHAQGAEVEAR